MRSRKKELEPISTAFAGTDEELARRLQEEEMLAATPRTRTRARNPDALTATLSKTLSVTLPAKDAEPVIDTPARREPSRDNVAEPTDSPSSRHDTLTALNTGSVAVTTARKRPDKPRRKAKRPSTKDAEDETAAEADDAEQHSSKKQAASPPEAAAPAQEAAADDADEEHDEEVKAHAPKRRRRRDPVVPDTPPNNGPSSVDSGDPPVGRRLRHSDRHPDRERATEAAEAPAPKRPRRPRGGAGRKLPKLPMVRQGMAWYRARTVHDDGQRIVLELTGFEGSDATLVLPLDSDRLWRGSYKGKDWRYLGDGAWAPKVPQHKPSKQHRRGRGGPRSSATHHAANGHGSAESDGHSASSSSDDEDGMDKHHGPMVGDPMGPHPYGSMGDQNWQGDEVTLKQAGSNGLGTRNGSAHSPRRRKSSHKPSRAPMDGDLPAACPPCMPPPLHEFAPPMGMLPLVPGTPPMDCCFYLHPAAMGLKPLSPDEVPPPPPVEDDHDDATELELVVAEAMMTCKEELMRHAWRDAHSQGAPSAADEEEVEEAAAAVALLGQASYDDLDDLYDEPDLVMVSPSKRGGGGRGRGGGRRNGGAWTQGRRRSAQRVTSTARSSLGTFRILLDALGEMDRPARLAAMALARSQLHHVLAVPAEALPGIDLLVPPPLPLFC